MLFFVYIFLLSYIGDKRKVKQIGSVTIITIVILCVVYFVNGHMNYQFWVDQNEFINSGIKEYSFILGMKNEEEPQIVKSSGRSNRLYANLSELKMYERTTVTQPFNHDYVGSRGNDHYFSFGEDNQYVYRIRGEINWESENSEIRGTVFSLIDERYQDLGFIDDVYGNWIFSDQRF